MAEGGAQNWVPVLALPDLLGGCWWKSSIPLARTLLFSFLFFFLFSSLLFILFFFFKILFFHLTEREQESTGRGSSRGSGRPRLPVEHEPDMGLDPRTLGS